MKRIAALSLLAAAGLAACDGSPTDNNKGRVPDVGEILELNVQFDNNCSNPILRNGRVVAVSNRAIIVADNTNPAGGFTDDDYRSFATSYDNLVWPVDTQAFGEPYDVDGNDRVIFFFTRAINELTEPGSGSYVNGLFFSRDLFPRRDQGNMGACPSSNVADLVYMLVPDPPRGGPFTYQNVKDNTVGVMAHETQHLISASRRLFELRAGNDEWNEVVWLNEGMSHIAEELVFYQAAGLAPRRNLDRPTLTSSATYVNAYNAYALQNIGRLANFFADPEKNSAYETDDDLATRGAIWDYLRYVADRRNGDDLALWNALVNTRQVGMANLRTALGTDPIPLFRDWAVMVYMDDAVAGVDARFTRPSWNFRSIFLNGINLRVRRLSDAVPATLELDPGAAGYFRFAVAGGQAQLRVTAAGQAPGGACTAVPALAVGQVHTLNPAAGGVLCVQQPGDYTLIAFYGAETEGDALPIEVSASGVTAVAQQPNPSVSPFDRASLSLSAGRTTLYQADPQLERRLRERSREMSALVRNPGSGARFSRASRVPDPTKLYLSVGRTR